MYVTPVHMHTQRKGGVSTYQKRMEWQRAQDEKNKPRTDAQRQRRLGQQESTQSERDEHASGKAEDGGEGEGCSEGTRADGSDGADGTAQQPQHQPSYCDDMPLYVDPEGKRLATPPFWVTEEGLVADLEELERTQVRMQHAGVLPVWRHACYGEESRPQCCL